MKYPFQTSFLEFELPRQTAARPHVQLYWNETDFDCQVILGDAFDLFDEIAPESIDLIITSPPYWGHREYGLQHNWERFNNISVVKKEFVTLSPGYNSYRNQGGVLGLEPYPEWYVQHLTEIFAKANRCLKPAGSMWVNIGDTYFARWASIRENGRQGLADQDRVRRKTPMGGFRQEKQLLLIPSRFAIAMQDRNWILRNDLIWHKPNATPRPEADRLRLTHEHFFHFVKKPTEGRPSYYYDAGMAEPQQSDVISVNTASGESGHTATFPRNLILPRILSSSPRGSVVLDPFCGTGRALDVAIEFGRRAIGFEKSPSFQKLSNEKVARVVRPVKSPGRDSGNYISEWFGRRIYPAVQLDGIKEISGANKDICPFLTTMLAVRTDCWKGPKSKGVCTISAVSNGPRQDWLACPHRVIHTDIVKESCLRIFGPDAVGKFPLPVSALAQPERLAELKSEVMRTGRAFVFFQDKLGGEISLSGTAKSPEMAFDVMIVEILKEGDDFVLGRYGILELQTMDFHGSYKNAVSALRNALDLHGASFPATLQSNLNWAGRDVEGPNIANVFKRTFYQMLVKFQLSSGGASAGTILALPQSVWDSWQPFLGSPSILPTAAGYSIIEGTESTKLNAFICIFDIDSEAKPPAKGGIGPDAARDISPVRVRSFVRVDPQMLAQFAFTEVPKEILRNISGADLIMSTIRTRMTKWWPDIANQASRAKAVSPSLVPRRRLTRGKPNGG